MTTKTSDLTCPEKTPLPSLSRIHSPSLETLEAPYRSCSLLPSSRSLSPPTLFEVTRSTHISYHGWPHGWTPSPLLLNPSGWLPGGSFHLKRIQPSTDLRVDTKPLSLAPEVALFVLPPASGPALPGPSSPSSHIRPFSAQYAFTLRNTHSRFEAFAHLVPEHLLPSSAAGELPHYYVTLVLLLAPSWVPPASVLHLCPATERPYLELVSAVTLGSPLPPC